MISIRRINKRFGTVPAVEDVSLDIAAGEFLTLLGPSGCGKTTLLRVIGGFETPDGGEIWLDGRDVTHQPPYRRDLNLLFQSYALFPHLNVRENVAFGLRMKRVRRKERNQRVDEALALVALSGLEGRKPSQLSGGQKQRVALARALVNRPKVLLLDEPLSALDAKLRGAMQLELKQLQRQLGITFITVTHDQAEALTMSDRIAVMNDGRLEQVGSAADIYHHPQTRFVATFIGHANLIDGVVSGNFEGHLHVQTPLGLIRVTPPATPTTLGAAVTLMIRPERLILSEANQSENGIRGVIVERIFRGEVTQLHVRCDGPTTLIAITSALLNSQCPVGAAVCCVIPPASATVIL